MRKIVLGILMLFWTGVASAQQANMYCLVDSGPPLHWAPCSSTTPLPFGPLQVTRTDRSGTITLGNSPQNAMGANAARRGCIIQNTSPGDEWISETTTAVLSQPSIWLPAGSYYICEPTGVPTTAISIIGATTSQPFTAREW